MQVDLRFVLPQNLRSAIAGTIHINKYLEARFPRAQRQQVLDFARDATFLVVRTDTDCASQVGNGNGIRYRPGSTS